MKTNIKHSELGVNKLAMPHVNLLCNDDLAQLRPVVKTILQQHTEVAHQWYRHYAEHFGDRRSLEKSEFMRVFEPPWRPA